MGLSLVGCGQAEEAQEQDLQQAAPSDADRPVNSLSNACYVWKGRGGAPPGYMHARALCAAAGGSYGFVYSHDANGESYFKGAINGTVVTGSSWAIYSSPDAITTTSQATFNSFTTGIGVSGSCTGCLY
jgi:hypothetical protein